LPSGAPGAVTIATNMAGRGTDIKLGGNLEMRLRKELDGVTDEARREAITEKVQAEIATAHELVKQSGGLLVIGTERHESRRVDNQLRGRSGRQGDLGNPVSSVAGRHLMRIFGSDRMGGCCNGWACSRARRSFIRGSTRRWKSAEESRSAQLRHAQERAEIR